MNATQVIPVARKYAMPRHRAAAVVVMTLWCLGMHGCDDSSRSTGAAAHAAPTRSSSVGSPSQPQVAGAPIARVSAAGAQSMSQADRQYAAILESVVTEDGLVRYEDLAAEPLTSQLDEIVAGYASEPPPDKSNPRHCMALWCNAYNANMLRIALRESLKPGFVTINEVPGVFSTQVITVAGEDLTPNALKDRLRAMQDPRIHAALVFGAQACPPLRNEPYQGERLDQQLNEQCFAWLDDSNKHVLSNSGVRLSQIFEWYAADFEVEPYNGPVGFIRKHGRSGGSLRNMIRGVGGSPRISYLPFNWVLNRPISFEQMESR